MDANLLKTLNQHLTPDTIRQISSAIGTDPKTASNAVSMALPVILGGLANNASNAQGASALHNALDDHDGSLLDNLSGFLGGGAAGGIGGAILGHIFGSNQAGVQNGVGRATGLNSQQVAQLLAMLAPIVMGVLGRMKQQQGINSSQLSNVLQQNASGTSLGDIASSVLGGLFNR